MILSSSCSVMGCLLGFVVGFPGFSVLSYIPYNPENKPWAYFRSKHFFLGLFSGGLIFRGAYFRDEIRVRKEDGLIIEG